MVKGKKLTLTRPRISNSAILAATGNRAASLLAWKEK